MTNDKPEATLLRMSADEAREALPHFARMLSAPRHRVVIEDAGSTVGVVISLAELRQLERYDREWDARTDEFRAISRAFAGQSPETVEAEVARALAEGRRRK